ncbi:hypothetical protein ACW5R3_07005 [Bizionia sp. KMM 8389]
MDNPFKKIVHNEELPTIIKKKVMADIDVIKLALDVTGLITIKYPKTLEDILTTMKKNENNSDNKK